MKTFTVPAGFTANIAAEPTLSIAPFGGPGTGKTRLICTAPGPVGVISLDKKTRFTIEKHIRDNPEDRIKFVLPERDYIREDNPTLDTMTPAASIQYYRAFVDEIKLAAKTLYNMKAIRTIAIDTGTVLFRNMFFAQYGRTTRILGRDRSAVWQEFEDFVNGLQGKNLIMTHQLKEIYENDMATGRMGPDGYKKLGHLVDTMVEMKSSIKGKFDEGMPSNKYSCRIMQSQSAPELEGQVILKDHKVSFANLAMQLRPESDVNNWL